MCFLCTRGNPSSDPQGRVKPTSARGGQTGRTQGLVGQSVCPSDMVNSTQINKGEKQLKEGPSCQPWASTGAHTHGHTLILSCMYPLKQYSQTQWLVTLSLVLRRKKLENREFKANLSYRAWAT